MRIAWKTGTPPIEVEEVVKNTPAADDDSALAVENRLGLSLESLGYTIFPQLKVRNRGDGRRGKIDLFIVKQGSGEAVGIEIDRKKARDKSIFKLESLGCPALVAVRGD